MATLQADDLQDLVTLTLKELGRLRWTDISTDLQEHIALPQILKKQKVQFDGGYGIQRNVMIDHTHSAKHVGLYEVDTYDVRDQMETVTIPWRHTNANYVFERRELAMNRGAEKLVSLVKTRRAGAMIALAELMEQSFWTETTSDDGVTPFPIWYWMTKKTSGASAATGAGEFGGGQLWSGTDPGGLSNDRWKNWTHAYSNITKDDVVQKMRRAYRKIGFKSPVAIPSYQRGSTRYVIYTNIDVMEGFEELGEAQNENLGRDLASMDGEMVFRGNAVRWVPYLDANTDDPIMFVDWGCLYPVFLSGEYMKEQGPDRLVGYQHTVHRVDIDTTWNLMCHDRRRLAVLVKT